MKYNPNCKGYRAIKKHYHGIIERMPAIRAYKAYRKRLQLTIGCFNSLSTKKIDTGIYKEICDFCKMKGVAVPYWDKRAMSVLLTKYNALGVSKTEPISITYQLNKRCKNLPEKVSLPYFIKALDMNNQYREVLERDKQNERDKDEFNGFAF